MKKTSSKNEKYLFENYKPSKSSIPVDYKGTHYLSKAQCMALEGITRRELDAYLKSIEEVKEETGDSDDYFDIEDSF